MVVDVLCATVRRRRCCVYCTMKPRRTCCQADIHSHRLSVTTSLGCMSSSQSKNSNMKDGWRTLLKIRRNILGLCITSLCTVAAVFVIRARNGSQSATNVVVVLLGVVVSTKAFSFHTNRCQTSHTDW